MTQDHLPPSRKSPAALAPWKLIPCLFLVLFVGARRAEAQNDIAYVYDESGRLVAVINPSGDTVKYTYDAAGNLLSIARKASSLISVLEFTPNSGPAGTEVTIYGTGFSTTASQNVVKFNGVAAAVSSATRTRLVTKVPAGATTGPISVTTSAGTAASGTPFTVGNLKAPTITGFSPKIGLPGAAVSITGSNFRTQPTDNFLKLNAAEASATSATATTIATSVPANAGSGRISVATVFGKTLSKDDFFVPPTPYTVADVLTTGRMAIGASHTLTVGTANKIGLIVFDGLAGQRVVLQASDVRVSSGRVVIYNPNKSILASGGMTTNGGFVDAPVLPADGTYTILVDPDSNYTGSMTLTLRPAPNVVGTITPGGAPVNVATTVPGQIGRLTFNGTAGQRVSLRITGVTVSGTAVQLNRPDGTNLATVNAGTGGAFMDTQTLPTTGIYSVVVDPSDLYTGSATLTLYSVPADAAAAVPAGGAAAVTTTTPGQNARFTFTGAAGQKVSLGFSQVTIPDTTHVSVLRPDGSQMAFVNLSQSQNTFADALTLPTAGTYTVFVDPQNANTGGATLTLYNASDVAAPITPGGAAVNVTTTVPGQIARLTFNGTAGQRVSLRISNVTVSGTFVTLNRPDGTSLASAFAGTGGAFMDTQTLPAAGTYSILVDPSDRYTGSTTLTLYNVPADASAAVTPGGAAAAVTTTVPGQNARFTFNGTAGQTVTLALWGATIPGSTPVTLYTPTNVALSSLHIQQGESALFNAVQLPVTGTYRVFIDPQGFHTGTMRINHVPAATGTITPGGAAVRLTTTSPGQNGRLTFSGTVGQRVSLLIFNVTIPSANVQINNPDGTALASTFVNVGGAFIDTRTLPATGTYSIILDPLDTHVGTASFALYNVVDATGTITPGGPPVAVNTTVPGQRAWLTFNGTAGQKVSLKIGPMTTTNARVLINKPDGPLAEVSVLTQGGFMNTQTLPYTGTYTVLFDPYNAYVGGATLTLYNASDAAATITPGGPAVRVSIATPGQSARVTFTGAAGQKVSLAMSEVTIPDGARVEVLRPDGTTLASLHISQGHNTFSDGLALPLDGAYTILIDPQNGNTGGVTLTLYNASDVAAPITPGGAPVTLTTTTAGQAARATFNGTAGQRVSLRVSGVTVSGTSVQLNRPDGTNLAFLFAGTGGGFIDAHLLPTTGTYSIVVDPSDRHVGSATLTLYSVPADAAAAVPAGGAAAVTTTTPGQNARFTFTGAAGQKVSFSLGAVTIPDSTHVTVYGPDGSQMTFASLFQSQNTFVDALTLPTAGTYAVIIDPQNANTGGVTMTLHAVSDVVAPVTPGGAAVRVTTTVPGQNARLTFSATAGTRVSVELSQVTIPDSTHVTLHGPNGQSLTSTNVFQGQTGFIDTQTLPTAGTYTILINPSGGNTGGITVKVLKH